MTPKQFKHWRKETMHMTQAQAAKALGMHPRAIYGMESGCLEVTLRTRLAMAALSLGLRDFPK